MFKKSILFGAILFGANSLANAEGLDIYSPGLYLGVQAGYGLADEGSGIKDAFYSTYYTYMASAPFIGGTASVNDSRGGFSGRAFVGYSFTKYFGLEAGYTHFANNTYDFSSNIPPLGPTGEMHVKLRNYAIDAVGKAILPFDNGFNIYGKLGVAYIHTTGSESATGDYTDGSASVDNDSWSAYRPTYGAGVSYNFNDNFSMDLAWTGIYGKNKIPDGSTDDGQKPTPTTNMYTVGMTYKFTNLS